MIHSRRKHIMNIQVALKKHCFRCSRFVRHLRIHASSLLPFLEFGPPDNSEIKEKAI